MSPVLFTIEAGVALVTLNQPERQNAWTPAMGTAYATALDEAARRTDVRVIVVTGAGGHFCPGGDGAVLSDIARQGALDLADKGQPAWQALSIAKPVIAAIPGVCFGYGLFQALCCDIRFAADDAKFSTAYARRGLVAEMGTSWLLPRAIGTGRAADLLLSARVVRAAEAERIGLVSRVMPAAILLDETLSYARAMAAQASPRSLRAMKLQLYADLSCNFSEALARAEVLLQEACAAPDFVEGMRSWQENRPPAFAPLPADIAYLDIR